MDKLLKINKLERKEIKMKNFSNDLKKFEITELFYFELIILSKEYNLSFSQINKSLKENNVKILKNLTKS